MAKNSTTP